MMNHAYVLWIYVLIGVQRYGKVCSWQNKNPSFFRFFILHGYLFCHVAIGGFLTAHFLRIDMGLIIGLVVNIFMK